MLVGAERVKMVGLCQSALTAVQMEYSRKDLIIQKGYCLQFVWRQLRASSVVLTVFNLSGGN